MIETLIQIKKGTLCAGLVVKNGHCVEAAPILAWTVSKQWTWLKTYFNKKGYSIFEVARPSSPYGSF